MATWRCTVCGYTMRGEEPPERCPQCGAPREKFVQVCEAGAQSGGESGESAAAPAVSGEGQPQEAETPPAEAEPGGVVGRLGPFLTRFRIHPISVHVPNGVLPASVLLLLLGNIFSHEGLKTAAVYNLMIVLAAMPIVLLSGYSDWQKRLNGSYSRPIVIKIVCGVVVTLVGLILVVWWIVGGEVSWVFLLFELVMLAAAGLAGHQGGGLVFGKGSQIS